VREAKVKHWRGLQAEMPLESAPVLVFGFFVLVRCTVHALKGASCRFGRREILLSHPLEKGEVL